MRLAESDGLKRGAGYPYGSTRFKTFEIASGKFELLFKKFSFDYEQVNKKILFKPLVKSV